MRQKFCALHPSNGLCMRPSLPIVPGRVRRTEPNSASATVREVASGRCRTDLVILPDGRRARFVGLRGELSCLVLPEDSPLEGVSRRTLLAARPAEETPEAAGPLPEAQSSGLDMDRDQFLLVVFLDHKLQFFLSGRFRRRLCAGRHALLRRLHFPRRLVVQWKTKY